MQEKGQKSICVFCGSNVGSDAYEALAYSFGQQLALNGYRLIYGGGGVGLMGAVAKGALSEKGEVVGIIPDFLMRKELGEVQNTELIKVKTMHQRKAQMADLSDAFVALPGGMGTMDELCEIVTWAQLGLHQKPIVLYNMHGYYDPLMAFFDSMESNKFVSPANRKLVLTGASSEEVFNRITSYQPQEVENWLDRTRT
ncbi:TIGR00730 family Rossman fold protein [Rapidithrix thailandica]|uniref:Cytokinin riboside 5'-monophosphate phosphoribohydrolase n=1 Tax=Rapidithrix thailandica TaxID=413964 RepID=A0AAW9RTU7_9BACT